MKPADGGPAFPVECDWSTGELRGQQTTNAGGWHTGITVRDYFAAKVMQAVMTGEKPVGDASLVASWSYEVADAMLKARDMVQPP